MTDQPESKSTQEHQELAVLVAYTEDDYIRGNGTDNGSAQAVADAIQAAGYTKGFDLSEDELSVLRSLLRRSIEEPKPVYPGARYRGTKSATNPRVLSREHPALRAKRLLLEKLGGPKAPAEPTDDEIQASEAEETRRVEELMASQRKSAELKRKLRENEPMRRRRKISSDPYWRYRRRLRRGVILDAVSPEESAHEAQEIEAAPEDTQISQTHGNASTTDEAQVAQPTAVENPWRTIALPDPHDENEHAAHGALWDRGTDEEDVNLEYGIANFGDLEDVILEPQADRSSRAWAQAAMQVSYGDKLVARRWEETRP